MSTDLAQVIPTPQVITYQVSEAWLAEKRERCAALLADPNPDYESVRKEIHELRTARTGVEKRRKDLKSAALTYGRQVDSVAAELERSIRESEEPLQAWKDAVDKAREKAKEEAEAEE